MRFLVSLCVLCLFALTARADCANGICTKPGAKTAVAAKSAPKTAPTKACKCRHPLRRFLRRFR